MCNPQLLSIPLYVLLPATETPSHNGVTCFAVTTCLLSPGSSGIVGNNIIRLNLATCIRSKPNTVFLLFTRFWYFDILRCRTTGPLFPWIEILLDLWLVWWAGGSLFTHRKTLSLGDQTGPYIPVPGENCWRRLVSGMRQYKSSNSYNILSSATYGRAS